MFRSPLFSGMLQEFEGIIYLGLVVFIVLAFSKSISKLVSCSVPSRLGELDCAQKTSIEMSIGPGHLARVRKTHL